MGTLEQFIQKAGGDAVLKVKLEGIDIRICQVMGTGSGERYQVKGDRLDFFFLKTLDFQFSIFTILLFLRFEEELFNVTGTNTFAVTGFSLPVEERDVACGIYEPEKVVIVDHFPLFRPR